MTSKYKPIVGVLKNYNLNSREKLKPGPIVSQTTNACIGLPSRGRFRLVPSIEPEIWRSEVQISVQVRIFVLNLNYNSLRDKHRFVFTCQFDLRIIIKYFLFQRQLECTNLTYESSEILYPSRWVLDLKSLRNIGTSLWSVK